ncbi:MAG: TlpA family protein disulfide reductase [Cloacibacterium sp.]|nr:TlpA family protein disulfide reductase [Cloacibacterium sp.]
MKKFTIALSVIISIASCTKKEAPITEKTSTETTVDSTKTEAVASTAIPEWSTEKVAEFVAPKKNDTLYVTNFFATWCGPCMKEIPHFKEKMEKMKNEKVKFTFISVDAKEDWKTAVNDFGAENNLSKHIVLLDTSSVSPDFFTKNFKTWTGNSIPFTLITKGEKRDETIGMMSKEDLNSKINSFK